MLRHRQSYSTEFLGFCLVSLVDSLYVWPLLVLPGILGHYSQVVTAVDSNVRAFVPQCDYQLLFEGAGSNPAGVVFLRYAEMCHLGTLINA